jgi:hypothetical protein
MELIPTNCRIGDKKKLLLPRYAGVYYVRSRPILTQPTKRQTRLPSHLSLNILEELQAPGRS